MTARSLSSWETAPRLPAGHFVSGLVYTDPDIYQDELRTIFAKTWRFACHESELPEPFDYRLVDHAGQSLVCIRGDGGEVRTFLNVCSHRGAKLLSEPSGNARLITCFYHRWTYDSRGACTGIPRPSGYSDAVTKDKTGLCQVRTESLHGLIFISLDDEAPPLSDFIGGSLDQFAEMLGTTPLVVGMCREVLDVDAFLVEAFV